MRVFDTEDAKEHREARKRGISYLALCRDHIFGFSVHIVSFLFFRRRSGAVTRVVPRRASSEVPLSRSDPETADRAELPGVREECTSDGEHLILVHALLCPFPHSRRTPHPCRPVWRGPLLVSLGLPALCLFRVWLWSPFRLSCCLSVLLLQQPVSHGGFHLFSLLCGALAFLLAHVAKFGFPCWFCFALVWWPRGS